jgi:hypothetical protein
VAIEVPLFVSNAVVLDVTEALMSEPGASRSIGTPLFENDDTLSVFVVEPTVTADEIHAGEPTPVVNDELPDAMTVAIPTDSKLSMAAF